MLHAPDIAERLIGLDLSEAFERFVLNDPEVLALKAAGIAAHGVRRAPLEKGTFTNSYTNWPVLIAGKDLAFRCLRSPIIVIDEPDLPPPAAVVHAAVVFNDWGDRMFELFGDGAVYLVDENGLAVPRSRWKRDDTYIEIKNGDMVEGDGINGIRPIYIGLRTVPCNLAPNDLFAEGAPQPERSSKSGRKPK